MLSSTYPHTSAHIVENQPPSTICKPLVLRFLQQKKRKAPLAERNLQRISKHSKTLNFEFLKSLYLNY